jgi:hypothetical protein
VPVTSKKKRQNGMATGEDGKYVGRLAEVVMSSGDVDRVMQGKPNSLHRDSRMSRIILVNNQVVSSTTRISSQSTPL